MASLVLSSFSQLRKVASDEILRIGESVPIPRFAAATMNAMTQEVFDRMDKTTTLARIYGPVVVVGDIHGNIFDLFRIMLINGFPPMTKYVFLGDYVDRGEFSIEVISFLLCLYITFPTQVILLRGNHEFRKCNQTYGFKDSVLSEYGDDMLCEKFNAIFDYLPLAALVNDTILCVHGGISEHLHNISQIEEMELPITEDTGIISDLVWSDPDKSFQKFVENKRGKGCKFGQYAFEKFRKDNNLTLLVRGHQCIYEGIEIMFGGKLITVFSTSSYSSEFPNSAGYLLISESGALNPLSLPLIPIRKRARTFFFNVVPISNDMPSKCLSLTNLVPNLSSSKLRISSRGKMQITRSRTGSQLCIPKKNNDVHKNPYKKAICPIPTIPGPDLLPDLE